MTPPHRLAIAHAKITLACALIALLASCSQEQAPERSQAPAQTTEIQQPTGSVASATEAKTDSDGESDPVTLRDIDASFEVLAEQIAAYSASEKEQALNAVRTELREIDARIDALALRTRLEADELSQEVHAHREETVDMLKARRSAVEKWVETMRQDSAQAWDDVRQGFARAYLELGAAFAEAKDAFED